MKLAAALIVTGVMFLHGMGITFAADVIHPTPLRAIRASGDLGHRLLLNYARLTSDYYRPDKLEKISPDWPGDTVGREILALTLLAQATNTEPPTLNRLIDDVATQLTDHGYLGPPLPAGVQNEQYLSGHSWLLRGLCEYHAWKHDPRSLSLVRRIVTSLLLPAKDAYANYPLRPEDRPKEGGVAGNITRQSNGWQLSTDVGCAFIMLDGATRAYELTPSPELESLIQTMIDRYARIDLPGVGAQTHATLSALRGILRFHASHPDPKYLDLVTRTYALYQSTATTEHYANYNWFGRPEWTEACAVVDSFMLATQLYAATADPHYLEDAQLTYYNALSHAQRPNGGFGCDLCTGSTPASLFVKPHDIFEAPFCCSMRGAEGLTAALTYSYLLNPPAHEITLPSFHDNTATLPLADGTTLTLTESTAYPLEGSVSLTILNSTTTTPTRLRLFIPTWIPTRSIQLTLNGSPVSTDIHDSFLTITRPLTPGDQLQLHFDLPLRLTPASHPDRLPDQLRYFHGPLLLGQSLSATTRPATPDHALPPTSFTHIAPATYRSTDGMNLTLSPIRDLINRSPADAPKASQKVLFPR